MGQESELDLDLSGLNYDDELEENQDLEQLPPLSMLGAIFPDISEQELQQILEKNNYSIEASMDIILNRKDEKTAPPKQVCRHFLAGGCYRKDCWFSHETEDLICKFWLRGHCAKGNSCTFSHQGAVHKLQNSSNINSSISHQSEDFDGEKEQFPALGDVPKKAFDFLSPTTPYRKIAQTKSATPTARFEISRQLKTRKQTIDTQWLSTGDAIASSYFRHRDMAINTALNRNHLFQKATEAYLSGNKAAARALSLSANQLNNQITALHTEAARKIFAERNKHLRSENGRILIDLHGLHPTEAIELLDDSLQKVISSTYKGQVVIITGTGHHSRGRSKVFPATLSHLQRSGWKVREGTLKDGNGGILLVDV